MTYTTGDTILISGLFYTFAGVLSDPDATPTLKLYYVDKSTSAGTGTVTHSSTGTYSAILTLPTEEGSYYYEWAWVANSKTFKRRFAINLTFATG